MPGHRAPDTGIYTGIYGKAPAAARAREPSGLEAGRALPVPGEALSGGTWGCAAPAHSSPWLGLEPVLGKCQLVDMAPRPTGGKRFAWEHANPIPSPFPIQTQPHPAPQAGGWSPAAPLWGKPPRSPKTAQHKPHSTRRDAPDTDPTTTTPRRLLRTRCDNTGML